MGIKERRTGVVIEHDIVQGWCETTLPAGPCCYGFHLTTDGSLVEVGRGKISFAKKWLDDPYLYERSKAYVNHGGGGEK